MDEPVKIYNFEVEDWHTYFVSESGILVHNTTGGQPCGAVDSNENDNTTTSEGNVIKIRKYESLEQIL